MNLTKILCKAFDYEEKGYVTIDNIMKYAALFLFILTMWGVYTYGLYIWLIAGIKPITIECAATDILKSIVGAASKATTYVLTVVIFTIGACKAYNKIKNVKVVSCKKEGK